MTRMPLIISADDHVIEPPTVWSDRLPEKYRDIGPRVKVLAADAFVQQGRDYVPNPSSDGSAGPGAWWHYEDKVYPIIRYAAAAGFPAEEVDGRCVTYDNMRPGCWQRDARLEDMALNGIEAALNFPNYPRFCGQIFTEAQDRELALLCVRAYNDWMVDEWAGGSGGRLIPMGIIPLWDAELAAEEVRRNAARGVRAVAFCEIPAWFGLPSIHTNYWDPFLRACDETGTVICMHVGSSSRMNTTSADAPYAVPTVMIFSNSAMAMCDWLLSGVLHRFQDLKLMFAECQIGWIPYLLERADDAWTTHLWSHPDSTFPGLPSDYYEGRVYSCFYKDPVGIELLHHVKVDQVLFETDFPHQDSTWPHTPKIAEEMFGHLPPDQVEKIARGNAIKLFGLDLS